MKNILTIIASLALFIACTSTTPVQEAETLTTDTTAVTTTTISTDSISVDTTAVVTTTLTK
jgi:uncharacterized protein YcfL